MAKTGMFGCSESLDLGSSSVERMEVDDGTVAGFSFVAPENQCEFVPMSAEETLKNLGISKNCTLGGITVIPGHESILQADCKDRNFNRFAWFAPIDDKGSTPTIIKKLLYCLHHVQKYYQDVQKPNAKTAPFEPANCTCKDAHVTYRGGMSFHYVTEGEDIVSVPVFKVNMFIDVASTGGFSAMTQAYQFVVLETPITFDLVECIYRSCKHQNSAESAKIVEVLKSFWCDIASHMASTNGNTELVRAHNFMAISFEDLFDDISRFCVWRLFRFALSSLLALPCFCS